MDDHPFSLISPGTEFRPIQQLQSIFGFHPWWPRLQAIVTLGGSAPMSKPPSTEARLAENDAILAYGNHGPKTDK